MTRPDFNTSEVNMEKQRGYIEIDFGAIFLVLVIVGVVIEIAISYVAPWVWGLVRPLLHALTA